MLIEASTLQNPFLADLVSLADPRSEYSYLNYCKQTGRIYSYYMRENHYLSRAEYNRYCQWVVARLPNLRFNSEVQGVLHDPDSNTYLVTGQHAATGERFMVRCRKLVLGLGSQPSLPACCDRRAAPYIHSADYLRNRRSCSNATPSPSWAAARARPRSFTTCCATAPDTTTAWPGSRARRAFSRWRTPSSRWN